ECFRAVEFFLEWIGCNLHVQMLNGTVVAFYYWHFVRLSWRHLVMTSLALAAIYAFVRIV
ncbi:MAG: hypothetical protein P8X88_04495, partial [Gammaproteobacteria bacterium]